MGYEDEKEEIDDLWVFWLSKLVVVLLFYNGKEGGGEI